MTAPDANSATDKSGEKVALAAIRPSESPAPTDKSSPIAKARNHNIRVCPAVLDAAGKDSAALLQSLHTVPTGLTQAEAEARARAAGPNEVAQEHRRGWLMALHRSCPCATWSPETSST